MKTNKVLKRLGKIEALMSDVTKRYSASAPHIREVLHDARAAVTRAKEAVSLQDSSRTAKHSPAKPSKPRSKATPEDSKPKRRISDEGMKRIIAAAKKRWALKRAETKRSQSTGMKKTAANNTTVRKAALKIAKPEAGA